MAVSWQKSFVPIVLFLLAGSSLALVSACDDGDESPGQATAQPSALAPSAAAASANHSSRPSTGVEVLDRLLTAIDQGDRDAVLDIVRFQSKSCETQISAAGGGPECPSGTAAGSLLPAVEGGRCQGAWLRRDQAGEVLDLVLSADPEVFAVSKWRPTSGTASLAYTVILSDSPLVHAAPSMVVTDEGVISINAGCSASAREMASRYTEFVILPPT